MPNVKPDWMNMGWSIFFFGFLRRPGFRRLVVAWKITTSQKSRMSQSLNPNFCALRTYIACTA